jgi:glycosyltransferase involved in cell wall biosynthesis
LPQCLNSLLTQSYCNLEVLIIDDGSDDGTAELSEEYAKIDLRVTVLRQENMGVSAARNLGLTYARGELITFLDADDWLDPQHLQQLYEGLEGKKYDCTVCGYWLEYPKKREKHAFSQIGVLNGDEAMEEMLSPYLFHGSIWNKMFRTAIIKKNNILFCESVYYFEDALFCAEYFSHCGTVRCIPSATYRYRRHPASALTQASANTSWVEKRLTSILAFDLILPLCRTPRASRMCSARREMEYAETLRCILSAGDGGKVAKSLKRTVCKGIRPVLAAPLRIKEKAIHFATALCPQFTALFFAARKKRFH